MNISLEKCVITSSFCYHKTVAKRVLKTDYSTTDIVHISAPTMKAVCITECLSRSSRAPGDVTINFHHSLFETWLIKQVFPVIRNTQFLVGSMRSFDLYLIFSPHVCCPIFSFGVSLFFIFSP